MAVYLELTIPDGSEPIIVVAGKCGSIQASKLEPEGESRGLTSWTAKSKQEDKMGSGM